MSRTFRPARCALAVGLAFAPHAAAATEWGSISYPPQAASLFGTGIVDGEIVLSNVDTGIFGFSLTLVLPQDYRADTKVRIIVYLTTAVAKPCNMAFEPVPLTRWRPGVAPSLFSTGLAPANGSNLVAFPNNNKVMQKVFTLARDPAFPGGQRPGDALRIGFGREAGLPEDTCNGNVQVPAIDIRYPRAP